MSSSHHIITTITGPSGSGKTVLSRLLKEEGFEPLVSTTTRAPRQGEQHGVDYYFVSVEEFHQDLASGKFMENVEYNGVLYGVSACEAERAFAKNRPAVLVAEPHGVEQIGKFCDQQGWSSFKVFVDNEDALLLGRLLNRLITDVSGTDPTDAAIGSYGPWTSQLQQLCLAEEVSMEDLTKVLRSFLESKELPLDEKRIEASAQRLKSFAFEQVNWVQPARAGAIYDYVAPCFSKDVEDDVVMDILNQVRLLNKNITRPRI